MDLDSIKDLKNFGYTLLKNVVPEYQINLMRNKLEELLALESLQNTIFHSQDDQIILRSIFAYAPEIFLGLLELEQVNSILGVIYKDGYTLQSMNASRANPIGNAAHDLRIHTDSRLAVKGDLHHSLAVGVAVCIDDFTAKNGATRVWPFSHLSGLNPVSEMQARAASLTPTIIEAKSGDVYIFLGHLWHAIGPNRTSNPRWGIFSFFNPWWIKPTWDYRECGEEIFQLLTPLQKQLLGFTTQVPSIYSPRSLTKTKIEDLPSTYSEAKKIT